MRFVRWFLVMLYFVPATLLAQERSQAILVLDGSGSMWGQIDGTAKIAIAQDVVGQLLQTLPDTQVLGLTVYGHRRKGDCADIETLVVPGAGTRGQIAAAVNAISPKGKTPMIDAVRQAAEALRYTEEAATVILVSDGIETCNGDPCAAARALEQAGVNFTVHVVGFDVSDPQALAQMQCLADETGGTFRTAANATELADALTVISQPEPVPGPAPEPVRITVIATDGPDGPRIDDNLVWTLRQGDTEIVSNQPAPGFHVDLLPGEYVASVLRTTDEATAEKVFGVGEVAKSVVLELPEFRPAATLDGPDTAVAGSTQLVRWTGPNGQNDYIDVSVPGERGSVHYTYTREGPTLELLMPPKPGSYELRYVLNDGKKVLATQLVDITEVTASLTAPEQMVAGSTVRVGWTGPNYQGDYVALSRPGETGLETYAYTRDGDSATIKLPADPGAYELRYVMANGTTVLATLPVTVTDTFARVSPPTEAAIGATIEVPWEGPDNASDYVGLAKRGEDRHLGYAYTRDGSPARLQMPAEPGDYDVIYVLHVGGKVIARAPISVTGVTASVAPPEELTAGATVQIPWQGPGYRSDYIAVLPRGGDRHLGYAYTRDGNPAAVTLPAEPGAYDIGYVLEVGGKILARMPVIVTGVSASVTPPDGLIAGATVQIPWQGPDYQSDYIAVLPRGSDRHISYAYTRTGNPVALTLPPESGDYDIGYVLNQGGTVLIRVPVSISGVGASVSAPDAALVAGAVAQFDWQGPDYPGDYIALFPRAGGKYVKYVYTRLGSPAKLALPAAPGDFDIAYVMNNGSEILASVPVTVAPVSASVTAPEGVLSAGAEIAVPWQGPDYQGDYIAVLPRRGGRHATYVYTRTGNPVRLRLPDTAGDYDIGYVMREGTTVLVRVPVTVGP